MIQAFFTRVLEKKETTHLELDDLLVLGRYAENWHQKGIHASSRHLALEIEGMQDCDANQKKSYFANTEGHRPVLSPCGRLPENNIRVQAALGVAIPEPEGGGKEFRTIEKVR